MNNAMTKMYQEMNNFVTVKACVFKRGDEYATVLCTVLFGQFGCDLKQMRDGSIRPDSYGTYIRVMGRKLITPLFPMTLTSYEKYLKREGWSFAFTVKEARGKQVIEAFDTCRSVISIARKILR